MHSAGVRKLSITRRRWEGLQKGLRRYAVGVETVVELEEVGSNVEGSVRDREGLVGGSILGRDMVGIEDGMKVWGMPNWFILVAQDAG